MAAEQRWKNTDPKITIEYDPFDLPSDLLFDGVRRDKYIPTQLRFEPSISNKGVAELLEELLSKWRTEFENNGYTTIWYNGKVYDIKTGQPVQASVPVTETVASAPTFRSEKAEQAVLTALQDIKITDGYSLAVITKVIEDSKSYDERIRKEHLQVVLKKPLFGDTMIYDQPAAYYDDGDTRVAESWEYRLEIKSIQEAVKEALSVRNLLPNANPPL